MLRDGNFLKRSLDVKQGPLYGAPSEDRKHYSLWDKLATHYTSLKCPKWFSKSKVESLEYLMNIKLTTQS